MHRRNPNKLRRVQFMFVGTQVADQVLSQTWVIKPNLDNIQTQYTLESPKNILQKFNMKNEQNRTWEERYVNFPIWHFHKEFLVCIAQQSDNAQSKIFFTIFHESSCDRQKVATHFTSNWTFFKLNYFSFNFSSSNQIKSISQFNTVKLQTIQNG